MNLFVRLFRVFLCAFFRSKLDFFDTSIVKFHVWPTDLDINQHMTNSRYLSVMDLGRTDLMIRTGLGAKMKKYGWGAVLGSAAVRWRRALGVFHLYELHTRVLGWDEKWVFIEQTIYRRGDVICHALVKGLFVHNRQTIPMQEIIDSVRTNVKSPPLPNFVVTWLKMEEEFKDHKMTTSTYKRKSK